MNITDKEREKLYRKVLVDLGYPIVSVELSDSDLDILLDNAIEDYSEYINDWLLNQQWGNIQNMSAENSDMLYAFMTKTLDFEHDFSNAYSRQVELGNDGAFPEKWSLQTDYITITGGTQTYEIPENREVTTVLWLTNPQINKASFRGMFGSSFNGGYGFGGGAVGTNNSTFQAASILPMYSVLSLASDINMRENIFQSPMTYRVTQFGKKKLLWLYPIPNSRYQIRGYNDYYDGCKVYYYYYDTSDENRDECVNENKDHIILTPADASIEKLQWGDINSMGQNKIRKLLSAYAKRTIGMARGKFNGELNYGDSSLQLDYRMLLDQANTESETIFTELKEYLDKFDYATLMEKKASIAENLNKVLSYTRSNLPIQIH